MMVTNDSYGTVERPNGTALSPSLPLLYHMINSTAKTRIQAAATLTVLGIGLRCKTHMSLSSEEETWAAARKDWTTIVDDGGGRACMMLKLG